MKSTARNYNNIVPLNSSGIDLYARDTKGNFHWIGHHLNYSFSDDNVFNYTQIDPKAMAGSEECEYQLYFPMYNTVTYMKIGVPEGSSFEFIPANTDVKPIVVYGTSIAQGASASRPGLAWTNTIGRELDVPVINLGFSGCAMMESSMFDVLSSLDASLYIIDCIPNVKYYPNTIVDRTISGVKKIRETSKAPILLVESFGSVDNVMCPIQNNEDVVGNQKLKEAYNKLVEEGIANIFYLTNEEIGPTEDSQIDAIHPNDLGMRLYANAYEKKIKEINAILESVSNVKQSKMNSNVYNASGQLLSTKGVADLSKNSRKNGVLIMNNCKMVIRE